MKNNQDDMRVIRIQCVQNDDVQHNKGVDASKGTHWDPLSRVI